MALLEQARLTYEDYAEIPADGRRHEIIDGEHHVSPAPSPRHQAVVTRLFATVGAFCRERGLGQVFTAPIDVLLGEHDVVQPDFLWLSESTAARVTETCIEGAPDLVAEILSPTSHRLDRNVKRNAYEQAGVGEYWLLDPAEETVEVFRRVSAEGFDAGQRLAAGATLESAVLTGFSAPVAAFFR